MHVILCLLALLVNSSQRKYFLIIILVSSTLISIPLISPHFFHTSHYFHIAIHEAGFLLAVFLCGMTLIAYQETKITRMLFSAAAFGVLAIGQIVYMFEKIDVPGMVVMNMSGGNVFDLSVLVMTALFALGLFYKR